MRSKVLRLLRDEPVQLLSRQLGVEIFRLEQWREKAIGGIDASLKQRKGDPVQAELDSAMKRIGELTMQVELLEAKTETCRPFGAAEVAAMSAATSPGTGLAYGLRRVCAAWGMARSSFYAMTDFSLLNIKPANTIGKCQNLSNPGHDVMVFGLVYPRSNASAYWIVLPVSRDKLKQIGDRYDQPQKNHKRTQDVEPAICCKSSHHLTHHIIFEVRRS